MPKSYIDGIGTVEKVTVMQGNPSDNEFVRTVQSDDGERIKIVTTLPDVYRGIKGILLTVNGKTTFIREPYSGD